MGCCIKFVFPFSGCDDSIEFDCEATDVCDLKNSYIDYDVALHPAHDCMIKKCPEQWLACPDKRSAHSFHNQDEVERLKRMEKFYKNVL